MANLTPKQRQAITTLLAGFSQDSAAVAAGVSRKTVNKWLHDPTFAAALREAGDDAIREASLRLVGLLNVGIDNYIDILAHPARAGSATKLRAIDMLLTQAVRFRELSDIADRLAALEARS